MEKAPQDKRRSRRYDVEIPATLRGKDDIGRSFFQRTTIVSIDLYGARIRTPLLLRVGEEIEVQPLTEKVPRRFRVVWIGSPGTLEEGTAGLTFVKENETWDLEALCWR